MAGAMWEFPTNGQGVPDIDQLVIDAVGEEYARLMELEAAAQSNIPLPAGWAWKGQLQIAQVGLTWMVRATLLPRALPE